MTLVTGIGLANPSSISNLFSNPVPTLNGPGASSTAAPDTTSASSDPTTATSASLDPTAGTSSSTDSQTPTNTQLTNALTASSASSFLHNKTAVIAVAAGSAAVFLLFLICLITCLVRRRRRRQRQRQEQRFDRELDASYQATMAQASRALDPPTRIPNADSYPAQANARGHSRTYSESSGASHGTYALPPLAHAPQQDFYNYNYNDDPAPTPPRVQTPTASTMVVGQPPSLQVPVAAPPRAPTPHATYWLANAGGTGDRVMVQSPSPAPSLQRTQTPGPGTFVPPGPPPPLPQMQIVQPQRAQAMQHGHAHADSPLAQKPSQSADVLMHVYAPTPPPQLQPRSQTLPPTEIRPKEEDSLSIPAVYLSQSGYAVSPLPADAAAAAAAGQLSPTMPITPTPFPNPFDAMQDATPAGKRQGQEGKEEKEGGKQLEVTQTQMTPGNANANFLLSPGPLTSLPNPYGAE